MILPDETSKILVYKILVLGNDEINGFVTYISCYICIYWFHLLFYAVGKIDQIHNDGNAAYGIFQVDDAWRCICTKLFYTVNISPGHKVVFQKSVNISLYSLSLNLEDWWMSWIELIRKKGWRWNCSTIGNNSNCCHFSVSCFNNSFV